MDLEQESPGSGEKVALSNPEIGSYIVFVVTLLSTFFFQASDTA